jgi:hypothetical protein
MPERPIRIAELRADTSITALSNRLFEPAAGRESLPIADIRDALRAANPTLDLDKPDRLPEGTVIAVPDVAGTQPIAEATRPIREVPVEALRDTRPELGTIAERLDERFDVAASAATDIRGLTLATGDLRKIATKIDSLPASSLLDKLRANAEDERTEADAAGSAQAEALKQLERDVEELVGFLSGAGGDG